MRIIRSAALFLFGSSHLGASVEVIFQDVSMQGLKCGHIWPFADQQGGVVVYPKEGKHPLVSYAHGWSDGGSHLDEQDLRSLFSLLASAGYVVVAPKGPYNLTVLGDWCENEWQDQLQAMRWARNSSLLSDHIDLAAPTAVAGHSMGGLATLRSASQAEEVKALNIVAAVAQHPAKCLHQILCPQPHVVVPTMFTVGETDELAPHVRSEYNLTSGVPKVFAEITGVGHTDPSTSHYPQSGDWAGPPKLENHYVLDWLNCFLKHNTTACALAQCNEPQSSIPTTACVTEGVEVLQRAALV